MMLRIYAALNATVHILYHSDLRICSSRQRYSAGIVQFRLAHVQQSLKRRTHWFSNLFAHILPRAMFDDCSSYIGCCLSYSTYIVQYRLFASAAVPKATVQTLFNLIVLSLYLSLSFSLSLSLSLSLSIPLLLLLSLSLSPSLSLSLSRTSADCSSAKLKLVHCKPFCLALQPYDGVAMWNVYSL
jgi:hypothetical protein